MRVIVLLTLCFAAAAAIPTSPERIVGGTLTTIQQYPMVAALLFSSTGVNHRQSCGGIIVTQRSIVTAAHCTHNQQANRWRARVGSTNANSGGSLLSFSVLLSHPQYNRSAYYDSDIAILRTTSNIAYSPSVQPGSFASANYFLPDNSSVWTAGWGTLWHNGQPSEQLRHVEVRTINQNTCINLYVRTVYRITNNMLCAGILNQGGRDACQGDSGGPLLHRGGPQNTNNVVGVVSFGVECARRDFPGIYARVTQFIGWIQNNA